MLDVEKETRRRRMWPRAQHVPACLREACTRVCLGKDETTHHVRWMAGHVAVASAALGDVGRGEGDTEAEALDGLRAVQRAHCLGRRLPAEGVCMCVTFTSFNGYVICKQPPV